MKKWKKLTNNEILEFSWGYVSYNPDTEDHLGLTKFGNLLGGNLVDGEETALRINKGNKWLILTGDFRKQYEKCKTQKDCLAVYKKNIKHRNNLSND